MAVPLLAADEPPPFLELAGTGASPFLITVDHASARIPRSLLGLGLPEAELERHIAWDIGALAVGRGVALALGAPLLATNYSRLVIDCNRDPAVTSSIPTTAEYTDIPGNAGLTPADRAVRIAALFEPYHARLREILDARLAAARPTIVIAQHSMTAVYKGSARPMHAAVLYNRDRRFAAEVLARLREEPGLVTAENEPYFVSDDTDYTIPRHAEARGLLHVEIEIRQDLIRDVAGQQAWARRMVRVLTEAAKSLTGA